MVNKKVRELDSGLYLVFWKNGGYSLASVGMLENGDKWLAPTNWVHPSERKKEWRMVKSVIKI